VRPLKDSELLDARLRRSPKFLLRPNDELEPGTRAALGSLAEEPDFFGVLEPAPGSALPARAISRDAALLLYQLAEPARVPRLLAGLFGAGAPQRVRELIVDGILEIERDGVFDSGISLLPGTSRVTGAHTRIAQLSLEAIEYVLELRELSVRELARRLYLYNRTPGNARDHRRFGSPELVISYLTGSPTVAKCLASDWAIVSGDHGWIQARSAESNGSACFKLYVSPVVEDLPEVFGVAIAALRRAGCSAFKVGADAVGLLRPDKLVAYFSTIENLQRAAAMIERAVAGVRVQGVPFSGVIDPPGLMSWGMDPPAEEWIGPAGAQSWRQWVVERLAVHVAAAREAATSPLAEAALSRLALDGVDIERWTPSLAIWAENHRGAR
jgi:hypothetical protein